MLLDKRIDKITGLMNDERIDLLILGPSPDLQYLTGLHPVMDERFKALFILSDKRCFYIIPELYYEETREVLGEDVDIFKWSDTDGFLKAIEKANKKYNLDGRTIGVNDGVRAVDMIDMQAAVDARFSNGCSIMENVRVIKTNEERDNLRQAARIADAAAGEIIKHIRPGITEKDIKKKLEELLLEKGGQGLSFDPIIASGPNSSKPHYFDDSRIIEQNDLIVMDFGCKYNGYVSDMSRTVFVGEPTEEQKKIYSIVVEANTKGEEAVRQGVTAEEVDKAARKVIKDAGYGEYFINRTGHGIGTAVHEAPYIKEGNKLVLENGMSFSVEPGIYLPGRFGMRVENIVLIEDGKAEILNKFTKDMIVIK